MASGLRLTDYVTTITLDDPALAVYAIVQYSIRTPEIDASSEDDPGDGETVNGIRYKNVDDSCRLFFQNTTAGLQAVNTSINLLLEQARLWQKERRGRPVFVEFQLKSGDAWYRSEVLYGRSVLDERARAPWQLGGTANDWLLLEVTWQRRFYWEASSEAALNLTNGNGTNTTSGLPVYNHDDADTGSGYHDNWWTIAANQISGDLPAPVRVELRNDVARATAIVYLGRSASAVTYGTSLTLEGESATLSGGSTVSDSDSSGGSYGSVGIVTASNIIAQWALSKTLLTALAAGWYRVFMRVANAAAGDLVGVRFRLSVVVEATVLQRTNWATIGPDGILARQLHDLGSLQLPPASGAMASPKALTLWLEASRQLGTTLKLDFLSLMPTESARTLQPKGYYTPNTVTLVDDGITGDLYTFDGTDRLANYLSYGPPLVVEPGKRNTFYMLCDNDQGQSEIMRQHNVKMFYRPRRLTI